MYRYAFIHFNAIMNALVYVHFLSSMLVHWLKGIQLALFNYKKKENGWEKIDRFLLSKVELSLKISQWNKNLT